MSANEPITRGECERVHNGLKDQFDEIKTGIDKIWVKVDAQKSGNGFVQAMHELPTFMKTVLTMIPVVIVLLGYFGFKPGEMKPEAVKAIVSQAVQDMEKIAPAQVPASTSQTLNFPPCPSVAVPKPDKQSKADTPNQPVTR